jgi:antibiotic biosynthesis monooxygenase (ABM) superfamily enzyme
MAVTVLIKRVVSPENEIQMEELYREMRKTALTQEGHFGSETLKRIDVEGEFLIISKWQHVDNWSKWLVSEERRVLSGLTILPILKPSLKFIPIKQGY